MPNAHAPGVHSQAGTNHITDIKRKELGGASATNCSGLPNAVVHNHGYEEAQWGEYLDTFPVMWDVVTISEGMKGKGACDAHLGIWQGCNDIMP